MKKYVAKKMIKQSRFVDFYSSTDKIMQGEVLERMTKIIREESAYCDKENYTHLCNIFSALAIYEALQIHGMSESAAFETVRSTLFSSVQTTKENLKKLSGKRMFWKSLKKSILRKCKKDAGEGWEFTWFQGQPKTEFRFEVCKCVYASIFLKCGLEKLGQLFCRCGVICCGDLKSIDFRRKGTLCYGDDKCDFKFVKYPFGEEFSRTQSK